MHEGLPSGAKDVTAKVGIGEGGIHRVSQLQLAKAVVTSYALWRSPEDTSNPQDRDTLCAGMDAIVAGQFPSHVGINLCY